MKGCRTLTKSEISEILNTLSQRDKVLVLTGLTYGTRISETLSLTFGDVSGKILNINSLKGSENASFPIPSQYADEIGKLRAEYESNGIEVKSDTHLFLSRKGDNQSITRIQASRIIESTCEKLGIDGKVNTHSFRKTFVTAIYEKSNFNLALTKKYSRHKSLSNLDYYINTTSELDLVNNLTW